MQNPDGPHEVLSTAVPVSVAELSYIEQCLQPQAAGQDRDGSAASAIARESYLKIGASLIEAFEQQDDVTIAFTEDELWALRDRVSVYAVSGSDATMGMRLKVKIYRALIALSNERVVSEMFSSISRGHAAGSPDEFGNRDLRS